MTSVLSSANAKRVLSQASSSIKSTLMAVRSLSTTAEFTFNKPFKLYKLESGPENKAESSKDELLTHFRNMTLWRRVEILADTMYKMRLIRGFCHLYDGQEAIAAGMEASLTKKDSIITAYREHVNQMGRGCSAEAVIAELLGKSTGCTKGKGGSMHMYYKPSNFYGGNGIVGAQVPVGAGIAFAHKYRNDGNVCVAMFGDGAANQGQIYEAANMAALWKLPFIFCIENNNFGMGTSKERASANTDFYTRGHYIPGLWMDGMDVLAVKTGFAWAKNYVLQNGPLFVELSTYRYHGHSMSDPGVSYRSREDVNAVRAQRDCIENVRHKLLTQKWATPEELKAIENEVRKEVEEAGKKAQEAPVPELKEVFTDVYENEVPHFIRGVEYETSVFNKYKE